MKISYNWLQSFFDKKLPAPEKLADLLTMHSFETEAVGRLEDDYLLDLDILPNRAHDCASHLGVAQEISVLLKYPLKTTDYSKQIKKNKESAKGLIKIEVKDASLCPRYTARAIVEVKVGASPKWLKQRLKVCGLRPISNIVDIANYAMLETGQPLHAFDADKLRSRGKQKTLIVRLAKKGEKITSLDNEKYDLDQDILVIADYRDPVCIAGIKGGKGPEIDGQTKRIILEAANFSPQAIRQGSQKIKLQTDASWRFERQLDPNLTEDAINMAAYLIQELAGGRVLNGLVDVYPEKVEPKKIILDAGQAKSLLGVNINNSEIANILRRLGFGVRTKEDKIKVTVPTKRLDINIFEDLIEEIGRVYGLEKISGQLPEAVLTAPERNEDLVYQNKIKDILINLGFSEAYNYSLVGDLEVGLYNKKPSLIKIANPISQVQKYMRPSLTMGLLNNVRENKKYFQGVRMFEIGKVFNIIKGKTEEKKRLAGVISLDRSGQAQEFYRLKGVIDSLLNKLSISDQWYDDQIETDSLVPSFCYSERRAEIKIGDDCIGWLAEINGSALAKMDIESKVAAFELDFEKLVELVDEERSYQAPSKYPAVVRDIALLVDQGTKVVEVLNLINAAGGKLIQDIDLFDIYQGKGISEDKKNLAFHIIYQSSDHTLTDKEVNRLQDKIIKVLEDEGGWEVRK